MANGVKSIAVPLSCLWLFVGAGRKMRSGDVWRNARRACFALNLALYFHYVYGISKSMVCLCIYNPQSSSCRVFFLAHISLGSLVKQMCKSWNNNSHRLSTIYYTNCTMEKQSSLVFFSRSLDATHIILCVSVEST